MRQQHKVLIFLLSIFCSVLHAQTYPTFGREIPVTITGDTVPDAMEPFLSTDGKYMFFNSLNNGSNTSLYYALYVNDSTFNFQGPLTGANLTSPPHLDAVASMDTGNRFFWVTTRNYPATYHNLMRGKFTGNSVTDTGRVYGNIYINNPGYIIMDAMLDYSGTQLYYANAYFNGCANGLPCTSQLAIGQMINDSTYNVIPTSAAQLAKVDDTAYLVYAENVTQDGRELYYTRIKHDSLQTELCVAVRSAIGDTFSLPKIIYTQPPYVVEAPTLSTDKMRLYYHKKISTNFKLYLRYRTNLAGINKVTDDAIVTVYPNPATSQIHIELPYTTANFQGRIYDVTGRQVIYFENEINVNTKGLQAGIYTLVISIKDHVFTRKISIL